jgi:hypothetical protein
VSDRTARVTSSNHILTHKRPSSSPHSSLESKITALSSAQAVFDVPLDTNKNYVERPALTRQLDELLQPTESNSSDPKRAALYGLGGSGKTELALRFAEKHRGNYTAIFWINGMDNLHMAEGFSSISRALGLGADMIPGIAMQRARDWLCAHGNWLLVVDNLDDDVVIDLLPRKFINAGMLGTILVTSRNERVKRIWNSIPVSDMEPGEAKTLLRNITDSEVQENDAVANALLKDLGHLPLAVDQAASFISETGITIAKYHQLFQVERRRLLEKYPTTQYNVGNRQNVMTTWEISFSHIQQEHPQASTLLLMLSLLYHEDIPQAILESALLGQCHWASNGEFEELPSRDRWVPKILSNVLCSDIGLVEAIAVLKKVSLVRHQENSRSLVVHPLVHFWTAQRLENDKNLKRDLQICIIGLVSSAFERQDRLPPLSSRTHGSRGLEDSTLSIWPLRQYPQIAPHALRCLKYAKDIKILSEPVALLSLSLLQVLEYTSFGDFQEDQAFALALIQHLEKFQHHRSDDVYLTCSAAIWRLNRLDLCSCRKYILISGPEVNRKVRAGNLCEECERAYREVLTLQTINTRTPRMGCVIQYLQFRLAWDPIWDYCLNKLSSSSPPSVFGFIEPRLPEGQPVPVSGNPFHPLLLEELLGKHSSWMYRYGLTVRRYLLLRTECEYHYGDRYRLREDSAKKQWEEEVMYTAKEPGEIAESFKLLCGEKSEEFRRSAFYASTALVTSCQWKEVERLLHPLVIASLESPVVSWSHERCIIRYTDALLKQDKAKEAQAMLSRIRASYQTSKKALVTTERSKLLQNMPDAVRNY